MNNLLEALEIGQRILEILVLMMTLYQLLQG